MLNPSTADGSQNDPTIRRCIRFAESWGFGAIAVANLFALRSTIPSVLLSAADPVGPANNSVIEELAEGASIVVAAWGAHPVAKPRAEVVLNLVRRPLCLGLTMFGQPRHPLYVSRGTPLREFRSGALPSAAAVAGRGDELRSPPTSEGGSLDCVSELVHIFRPKPVEDLGTAIN